MLQRWRKWPYIYVAVLLWLYACMPCVCMWMCGFYIMWKKGEQWKEGKTY